MTVASRGDEFTREELITVGKKFDIHNPGVILDETVEMFSKWPDMGRQWGVQTEDRMRVAAGHRLYLAV
jgi:serine/threonine-protein kinase HipA